MLNLNIDTSATNTDFPALETGDKLARIVGYDLVEGKNNWRGLAIKLETVNPEVDTKGKTLTPGFPFRYTLSLTQSESENAPDFTVGLARYLDAAFGEGGKAKGFNDASLTESVGKEVLAIIKKAKDPQYGETECRGIKAKG